MKNSCFIVLFLTVLLSGCGQPGPLYLPGTRPPFYVPPEQITDPETKKQEADKEKQADENKGQNKELSPKKPSEPDTNKTDQELSQEPKPQPVPDSKQPKQ